MRWSTGPPGWKAADDTVVTMPAPESPESRPLGAGWAGLRGEARGSAYDARWEAMAARGDPVHGEADLVEHVIETGLRPPPRAEAGALVLDAGCGTGRVAIELARRGHRTVGVDRDAALLSTARAKAPELSWRDADLVALADSVDAGTIDVAVLAGNVMIFADPGTEATVVAQVAGALRPGGLVVAGFQVRAGGYTPRRLDSDTAAVGLTPVARWSTWDRTPWGAHSDYQVSVHRRPSGGDDRV